MMMPLPAIKSMVLMSGCIACTGFDCMLTFEDVELDRAR